MGRLTSDFELIGSIVVVETSCLSSSELRSLYMHSIHPRVFTLEGAVISWKSYKQIVIAKSTMESKFIALDKCVEEVE